MDALCFDNDARSFCRNPFILTLIQDAPGVYPLHFIFLCVNKLQTASPARKLCLPPPATKFTDCTRLTGMPYSSAAPPNNRTEPRP